MPTTAPAPAASTRSTAAVRSPTTWSSTWSGRSNVDYRAEEASKHHCEKWPFRFSRKMMRHQGIEAGFRWLANESLLSCARSRTCRCCATPPFVTDALSSGCRSTHGGKDCGYPLLEYPPASAGRFLQGVPSRRLAFRASAAPPARQSARLWRVPVPPGRKSFNQRCRLQSVLGGFGLILAFGRNDELMNGIALGARKCDATVAASKPPSGPANSALLRARIARATTLSAPRAQEPSQLAAAVSRPATKAALKIRCSQAPIPSRKASAILLRLLAQGAGHRATRMTLPAGKATTVTEGHD